jgi:hypothetical protein
VSKQRDINLAGLLGARQAIAASRGQTYTPQPVKRVPCDYCRAQEYAPCVVKGSQERMDGFHPTRYVKAGIDQPTFDRPQPVDKPVDDRQYDQDGIPIPDEPDPEREWYP